VIEVHKTPGFGFLELVYQKAMFLELRKSGLEFKAQPQIPVNYKGNRVAYYIPDFQVGNSVIVEIKAQEKVDLDQIQLQIINYLVATKVPLGIYLNFGKPKLEFKRYNIPQKFQAK
jgi:GxxExxY protein